MTSTDAGQEYRHAIVCTYGALTLCAVEFDHTKGAAEDRDQSTKLHGIL